MKSLNLISTLLIVSAAYSVSSYAHDPKEHAKEKEAPNCEAMQGMEMGEMDRNDPVAIAMMKKCHNMGDKNSEKHMKDMKHMKDKETMKGMHDMEKDDSQH